MKYTIRELRSDEIGLLDDFLYEAIFVPEGETAPDRSIIQLPELQVYVEEFGSGPADVCYVAEADDQVVGAAWARIMNDYGHIKDGVPSIAISLCKQYRGHGIGAELLQKLLNGLRGLGYGEVSLSVQKANYAVRLYKKLGFEIYTEDDEEYIMVYHSRKG